MNTAQWHQEIVVKPIDEIVTNTTCPNPPPPPAAAVDQRKPRPLKEQALNCPRCNSTNTKFCYYNNYSLTQPRYFCKTCRRYWTEGGSLRNIPVGGGSRKNKRSAPSSTSKRLPDLVTPSSLSQSSAHNPKIHEGHDLNLGFSSTQDLNCISQLVQFPTKNSTYPTSCSPNNSASQLSSLELISGISSRGFASFMSMPDPNGTVYSSGFPMQEFKPTLNFSLDGLGTSGYGHDSLQGVQEGTTTTTSSGGRLLFPFDDSKHVAPNTAAQAQEAEQSKVQGDSAGYWTGMLGGAGSSW